MAKKIRAIIKLQLTAGHSPALPMGPALGQHGANITAFCRRKAGGVGVFPTLIFPGGAGP